MILPSKVLAAAVVAAAIPLAGPAAAAPLSQSLALNTADVTTVEQVQYRRYYDNGYYAYGAAPQYYGGGYYAYGAPEYVRPRYREWNRNYGNGSSATGRGSSVICPPDREQSSAYPSWMCR